MMLIRRFPLNADLLRDKLLAKQLETTTVLTPIKSKDPFTGLSGDTFIFGLQIFIPRNISK